MQFIYNKTSYTEVFHQEHHCEFSNVAKFSRRRRTSSESTRLTPFFQEHGEKSRIGERISEPDILLQRGEENGRGCVDMSCRCLRGGSIKYLWSRISTAKMANSPSGPFLAVYIPDPVEVKHRI